jgi:hypothetical protein
VPYTLQGSENKDMKMQSWVSKKAVSCMGVDIKIQKFGKSQAW